MEEFFSLQGEGFHTGSPARFIRIGGCDVGCEWCDVKESWNAELFPPIRTDLLVDRTVRSPVSAVIITGGEPLLYNLDYLCHQLKRGYHGRETGQEAQDKRKKGSGIQLFLESSGTQPLSGEWDWICLSPKRECPPQEEFYRVCNELKVIIRGADDFVWAELQARKVSKGCYLYLQPEWSRRDQVLPLIIRYIECHPWWKLSIQMHKYIGIP